MDTYHAIKPCIYMRSYTLEVQNKTTVNSIAPRRFFFRCFVRILEKLSYKLKDTENCWEKSVHNNNYGLNRQK